MAHEPLDTLSYEASTENIGRAAIGVKENKQPSGFVSWNGLDSCRTPEIASQVSLGQCAWEACEKPTSQTRPMGPRHCHC